MARKSRILIVDDDANLIKMIGLMLHRAGYEVAGANSGMDALVKVADYKPDLVVLDRMMPLMDGLEVARRIRSNPVTAQLPILMLSALGAVDEKVEGFDAGVDDYVPKPVEAKELVARTRALLMRANFSRPPVARTIAMIGAKGGVGVTSTAINLAVILATQGRAVTLVEMRSSGGTLQQQIKAPHKQDLGGLLDLKPSQIKRPEVERRLARHSSGLRLLAAPPIGGYGAFTASHLETIVEILASDCEFLILDLPFQATEEVRRGLELSDQLLLVTEPETLSVACARLKLEKLKEWDVFDRVDLVIVTRTQSASWLNRVEVENRLGMGGGEAQQASRWEPRALEVDIRKRQGVAGVIPAAPELLHESVRNGVPLVLVEPSAPAARALSDLADWLTGRTEEEPVERPVRYIE